MDTRNFHAATSRGFTLIELMVVLVIVGILTAIAVPAYSKHMVKSRRADAQGFLMEVAAQEESYFIDARAYTPTLATLSMTVPAAVAKYYTVTIDATDVIPPTFIVKATPLVGSPQNSDGLLSIDNTGVKTPASAW